MCLDNLFRVLDKLCACLPTSIVFCWLFLKGLFYHLPKRRQIFCGNDIVLFMNLLVHLVGVEHLHSLSLF